MQSQHFGCGTEKIDWDWPLQTIQLWIKLQSGIVYIQIFYNK